MSIDHKSDHETSGLVTLGSTLRCNFPPRHIWIGLSDPARTGGRVIVVNLTTLRENSVDADCILGPSDYPLLTHATAVAFSRYRFAAASALEAAVQRSEFTVIQSISPTALQKILDAARVSSQLPSAARALVG